MHTIQPRSLNMPESCNRYVLDTIDHHVNSVNQTILQLKDDEQMQASTRYHLITLPSKPKSLLSSINRRKIAKQINRDLRSAKSQLKSIDQSHSSIQTTDPRTVTKSHPQSITQLKTNSETINQSPVIKLNQNHYMRELNKIDSATMESLKSFIIHNEENNQLHQNMKKKLIRVIQREHRLFAIASDEYLLFQKSDYELKQSNASKNLDYILSKLNNADYYNINQRILNQNKSNKEKMKWKEMNMIENQRHEKVQRLFNRMDKKL